MRIRHELTITAVCPVDGKPDRYEAFIDCTRIIPVEDILAAVSQCATRKVFQEDLTQELARQLGVKITTTGYHSGVKTVCQC